MSTQLDSLFQIVSKAASSCYDLNGNGALSSQEQTVFYQYAERIVMTLAQLHPRYDEIDKVINDEAATELTDVWTEAKNELAALMRSVTSPKLRSAVSAVAFAIETNSRYLQRLNAAAVTSS